MSVNKRRRERERRESRRKKSGNDEGRRKRERIGGVEINEASFLTTLREHHVLSDSKIPFAYFIFFFLNTVLNIPRRTRVLYCPFSSSGDKIGDNDERRGNNSALRLDLRFKRFRFIEIKRPER